MIQKKKNGCEKQTECGLNFPIALFWFCWVIHSKHLSNRVKRVFRTHVYLTAWAPRERIHEIYRWYSKPASFLPPRNYRNERKLLNKVVNWIISKLKKKKNWHFGIGGARVQIFNYLTVKDWTRYLNSLRNSIILN